MIPAVLQHVSNDVHSLTSMNIHTLSESYEAALYLLQAQLEGYLFHWQVSAWLPIICHTVQSKRNKNMFTNYCIEMKRQHSFEISINKLATPFKRCFFKKDANINKKQEVGYLSGALLFHFNSEWNASSRVAFLNVGFCAYI